MAVRHALVAANRKRPAGEAGRFWGYYREERYLISIYVDPWEVGGPLMRRGRAIVGSDERHMGGAEPSQEVFSFCPLSSSSANP